MVHERNSNRYRYKKVKGIDFKKSKSLTQQSFKDAADVNNIVDKFVRTGVLVDPMTVGNRQPMFEDFSNVDFQTSMEMVAMAKSQFMMLPSDIRSKFDNNVAVMMDYIQKPENKAEAIKLGLIPDDSEPPVENNSEPPVEPVAKPVEPVPEGAGE